MERACHVTMALVEPEAQEHFEKLDLKVAELDEKWYAHDRSLMAIRNLLQTGVRMLVDMEAKVSALAESEARLYGSMQQLSESQKALSAAQERTEEALRRFLERSGNGHTP